MPTIDSGLMAMFLTFLTALGALLAAVFTLSSASATEKATRGATLLACLAQYVSIMKDRRKALEERSPSQAEEFYRELFDLHWSEFHLWHDRIISDNVMKSWLCIRKRNYDADRIPCRSADGSEEMITYKGQWESLTSTSENYFEIGDPFVKFMNRAHAGEVTDLKQLRKDTKI